MEELKPKTPNMCAICGRRLRLGSFNFCKPCYHEHKADIDAMVPWVEAIKSMNKSDSLGDQNKELPLFANVDIDEDGNLIIYKRGPYD